MLILGLDIAEVIENIPRLLLQVVYLLLEDVIHLLLIHLSLLLAGEADSAGKLLVFPLDALGDGETRLVPQQCDHLPARKVLNSVFFKAKVLQFRLDVTFRQLSQVGVSACDGLGVLDRWVQIHPVDLSLVERVLRDLKWQLEIAVATMSIRGVANAFQHHHPLLLAIVIEVL